MLMDKLIGSQSIIITLDVDTLLLKKLKYIADIGFSVVEINCVEKKILSDVLNDFPMLQIGASNIINIPQLEACYQAGVHFITSPGFLPSIAQTAAVYDINYIPGVATLSEAMGAMEMGCQQVRPFPANLAFCTLLNKSIPLLSLYPGEIEWEDAELFLNLPSVRAVSINNPDIQHLQSLSDALSTLN